jgi:four helix bundle protein
LAKIGHVSGKNYQDLIAWNRAMDFVETVYRESAAIPADERYGLTTQMRRAAVSVPANIAEGQSRRTDGEFLNHLSVAHGSAREVETHAMIAGRLEFLEPSAVPTILASAAEVGRLVTALGNAVGRRQNSRHGSTSLRCDNWS